MIMLPSTATNDEALGRKHNHFNKRVQEAVTSGKYQDEKEFSKEKSDLENLYKIDIASYNKNIVYILSVLKSDDMLYVSRAIHGSIWLVDDPYANIINPTYLNEHLFPYMKTKASIQLLKHIRQYLKDEKRVEEFYRNETCPKAALKWLSRCSIPFIESNILQHKSHVTDLEFKRLCALSVTVFQAAMKDNKYVDKIQGVTFLLHTHPDEFLNVVENIKQESFRHSRFSQTATKLIMKKAPERVMSNFLKYMYYIHIPTFIENVKREQIKRFVLELVSKDNEGNCYCILNFQTIGQFIKRMPKEEQFEFVKKVFLDHENILKIDDSTLQRGTEMFAIKKLCVIARQTPLYFWYEFAQFDVAFEEIITRMIETKTSVHAKYSMLNVLFKCAAENTNKLLKLLSYYNKTCKNDHINQKIEFVNKLLFRAKIYKRDEETWNTFLEIVNSMSINISNDNHDFLHITILHDVLLNKHIAEQVEENFSFNTFKQYRSALNQDGQNKVFGYLYNYIAKKVQNHNIQIENEFMKAIQMLKETLDLLIAWDKELSDYPFVLDKIRALVRLRKENAWKISMSSLYNMKRSWRRLMFEESVILNPSERVFVNALKHDPSLLARYKEDVETTCCNDRISLKQLLRKLRIYWPDTLANSWTNYYFSRLDHLEGHKAVARGICALLSQEQLFDTLNRFAPSQPKIDWNNTNELTLELQRYLAKNMHIARPHPTADTVLLYAKGDFLQYALPSLLAIYCNMGSVESKEHIPKLLNAPVSLQKHGLRLAFKKLTHEQLKFHLCNVWQSSKNVSIRAVAFVILFDLMCKETDTTRVADLWEILEVFIDSLSFNEDKNIYLKLNKIEVVPITIRPKFLVKSYTFLKSLLPHITIDAHVYEGHIQKLTKYTRNIMESMCPEFVENIIAEFVETKIFKYSYDFDVMFPVISAYLLCARDEDTQTKKYEKILVPIIERAKIHWDDIHHEIYFVRKSFKELLMRLYRDLFKYVPQNKMILPTKMFNNIGKELNTLPLPQNYLIIRWWKLVARMTEIAEKVDEYENWQQNTTMVSEFGKCCLVVLKEDVKSNFSCIYVLFIKVLNMALPEEVPKMARLNIYQALLSDKDFIQGYLTVLYMLPPDIGYYDDESKEYRAKKDKLKNTIYAHPSVEVRMHYFRKYRDGSANAHDIY